MPKTFREELGREELFHETLSVSDDHLDITIDEDGSIILHQVVRLEDRSLLRASVILSSQEMAQKLADALPGVMNKAKEIGKGECHGNR